ncbi:acyl-CoA dehydratase activase [Clostridium novyi]|uniref:Activator of 2-hydroxyglutaryl-CoA dehydratase (HSP70-class ATPase domain) n=1 Tax=Clostridium novyi (strain NT) TaxID=386415 RepID=A0Q1F4_CLONN|nr:acyl-CoA dehydratase activase [Clostridium novyi]ABK62138.1 activator of 2-hydroxyglutaryl-CoA dehydratase (HSP70-class ATPase domain) [Clostridium novyi NT]KEH88183.1 2-hydroxyglutaryl-CoA dehydratase [Clostridium novyi A str. NCTC 538]KEH91309.1 2-hydroxyglutaryl-CoA dehydratase [Clostridium novyi A str. BKT29909]KEH93680.1 2-hydroxyglutaryl-CoA dehydratase [Clostridium novyi A str. GD211209]
MKTLGIDLGSREVKIVLMENHSIVHAQKISTMSFYRDYCTYNGKILVDLEKLNIKNVDKFVSTGYGRNNTNLNIFHPINEIKAHVYGAFYETNLKDFTLLDIGGQDVKVVKVEKGFITDLELNDKCAASCGRYLENMANILEVSLDYMSNYFENPVELNSTCAVFSESELIGKIAEGINTERLCASVNYSLYKKLKPMLSNFKDKTLILTGGVSQNSSIKKYLQNDYNKTISLNNPQFNGAIGCCYYGENFL